MSRLAELATLIETLIGTAEQAASELSREELDPDRLVEIMNRRDETFRALQQAYAEANGSGLEGTDLTMDPKLRELAGKFVALDRSNMEKMQHRLEKLRGDVSQVKLQRRSLTAYGWVDPVHAPKGAFIDKTQG